MSISYFCWVNKNGIRRPLEEGPPGCEEFARSFIFDLRLRWNHIIALNFLDFHISGSSKGSISHFSCLMSRFSGLLDCLLSPKKERIALNPLGAQDLGWPQNHHENSSIFEAVSKATKAMKSGPKATQNHEKSTLESQEIQFLRKLIFAISSMPNACFSNPGHPNLDSKATEKATWKNMKNNFFFDSKIPQKAFRMGPQNHQKINKIQAWTTRGPSLCPPMSQDRPRIVSGSSRTPK